MADLVITPASVVKGTNANVERGIAGVAVTAGQAVYKDASVEKYLLADSNSATLAARLPNGIALHAAALNQPLAVQSGGDVTIGATLVAGTDYWLSDTPGGICPRADVGTGENPVLIGLAKSTTVLTIGIKASGVTLP